MLPQAKMQLCDAEQRNCGTPTFLMLIFRPNGEK